MRVYQLEREQIVPGRPEEVFSFFADAHNLEEITPPWLQFRVTTPTPIEMGEGTLIEYRLRLHGIPVSWLTRIETWEAGRRFIDVQVEGPYRLWRHTHEFEAHGDGATLMRDSVRYALPLGPLGRAAHALVVRRDLRAIFDHRREAVSRLMGGAAGR